MRTDDLVRAYLKNEKLNNEINDAFIKEVISQSLQTLLFPVLNIKREYYIAWVKKQEEFYLLQDEITNLFNQNQIKHIYFKGTELSKIYDDKYIRTRGDIDFYVSKEDIDKAKNLLTLNGYVLDNEDCMHHLGLEKNGLNVELHFNMFDDDVSKDWLRIFKDPFSLSEKYDGYRYKFKDEYHFLYCMMHFAHHLRTGAGIRYMLDFYYMMKKYNLDYSLLHKLIDEAKLNRLYLNICNLVFDLSGIFFDESQKKEDIGFFKDYLLSYGIHGYSNNETAHAASIHSNKFKYLMGRVFLINKGYRISKYPKMGRHILLYPICVICHLFYLLTHKLGKFFKFIFGKNKNKSLYDRLGI